MNIRQQKYKENRLKGMNIYNAARAAGYSHNYANKNGKRIEMLGNIGMAAAFEQMGITDQYLASHAAEALQATKNGKPDWYVRHKYYNSVCEMTERMKHKIEHSGLPQQQIILVRSNADKQEVFSMQRSVSGDSL